MPGESYIVGLPELEEQIKKLAESVPPEKVEPILLEGAEIVRDVAKGYAPVGPTHNIQKSIIAKLLERIGVDNPRSAMAGVDYRKAPHAFLVEFGVPGSRAKKRDKAGDVKYRRQMGAPSGPMPAHPFMRPAWDVTKGWVMDHIILGLGRLIDEGMKK
jgi:HK97 gp10 family phage protein